MKLVQCKIENFGKLSDFSFDFSEGIHIICQKNGWGKSTLAAFIRVMFFGFENSGKKDKLINERKRFMPWQGGVYGGSITFEVKGKQYIMRRVFDKLTRWQIGIISGMEDFEKVYGKRADKRRKLSNGGMKCTFYQFFPERKEK